MLSIRKLWKGPRPPHVDSHSNQMWLICGAPFALRAAAMPCCCVHALFSIAGINLRDWCLWTKWPRRCRLPVIICEGAAAPAEAAQSCCQKFCLCQVCCIFHQWSKELSVNNVFTQLRADCFCFHYQLTANKGQAVVAINLIILLHYFLILRWL